jgi:hypothetical protein
VQAILKARRAVGDTGEEQRAIRTIPRFGYRWVAATEIEQCETDAVVAAPSEATPSPDANAPQRSDTNRSRLIWAAAATIALAAIGVTAWATFASRVPSAAAPARVGIAAMAVASCGVGRSDREVRSGRT